MKKPIMALDVGSHRIGVAVSDDKRTMALPLRTVDARRRRSALEEIIELIEDYDVAELVVGWPLDMTGAEGRAVDRVRDLVDDLEQALSRQDIGPLPVHRWDERLSTTAADRLLIDADMSRARRKETVDQVAACKILEGFLAHCDGDRG